MALTCFLKTSPGLDDCVVYSSGLIVQSPILDAEQERPQPLGALLGDVRMVGERINCRLDYSGERFPLGAMRVCV